MAKALQIHIVGAGIAGLVLGRALQHRGLAAVLHDKAADIQASRRNQHAITLHPAAYGALLPILALDDAAFRRRVAVDAAVGGCGRPPDGSDAHAPFRANRGSFERLLAEGLEVRWERAVAEVRATAAAATGEPSAPSRGRFDVRFEGEQRWSSLGDDDGSEANVLLVGADGPHSAVRAAAAPSAELEVLPYAVYNGRRRYKIDEFHDRFGKVLDEGKVLETQCGQARLSVWVDSITNTEASVSYTYSRPAHAGEDALFRPQRAKSAAKDIPDNLFNEVQELQGLLGSSLKEVFNPTKMRQDRILNWLMRHVRVNVDQLRSAAGNGIVLIGDAAHAEPILGGYGANAAIEDGLELAAIIASSGIQGLNGLYDSRYEMWTSGYHQSKTRIHNMHHADRSNL